MTTTTMTTTSNPNRQLARTVIAEIEEPRGEWPLVGDRMLKPESIVSVDILTIT